VAAFVLWEAKAYDPDCGKQSDIIVVREDGDIHWVFRQEVAYWEEHFAVYKKAQRLMPVLSCAESKWTDIFEPDDHLNGFIEAIKFLASEQKKMRECRGAFQASLEGKLVNHLRRKFKKRSNAKQPSTSRKSTDQQ
jgi:hypothetical protein